MSRKIAPLSGRHRQASPLGKCLSGIGMVVYVAAALVAFGCFSMVAAKEPLTRQPVYNPHSKSYFQIFSDNKHPGNWHAARQRARSKSYKGVLGRLAVVDSLETHQFLVKTLGLNQRGISTWIGLRYWCDGRMLQWESGRPFSPSDPDHLRLWHIPWYRGEAGSKDACEYTGSRRHGFAPVYYRTVGGITRWQAVGAAKFFADYIVEYPTGGE